LARYDIGVISSNIQVANFQETFRDIFMTLNNSTITTILSLATDIRSDSKGFEISPGDNHERIHMSQLANNINLLAKDLLDISTQRLQVQGLRTDLKNKREEEGIERAKLQKKLNALLVKDKPEDLQSILLLLERTEALSDSYLDLEDKYHLVEGQLGQDEYTLSNLEQKLSSTLKCFSTTIDSNGYLPSQRYSTSSTATSYVDDPPLLSEYLSRVGDVNILEERLSDLDWERFEIEEQERLRSSVNISLGEESRQFLMNYDKWQSEIQAELDTAKGDVVLLRARCKEEGILGHGQGGDQDVCFSSIELENNKDDTVAILPPQTTRSEYYNKIPDAKRGGWGSRFSEIGIRKRPSFGSIGNPRPKSS
jgi:hypothetical protein